jgi:hypothetical protein
MFESALSKLSERAFILMTRSYQGNNEMGTGVMKSDRQLMQGIPPPGTNS